MTSILDDLPSLADIETAQTRIQAHTLITPVLQSEFINRQLGAEVFFKCENLQRIGAFKFRGACNAVLALTHNPSLGVATHSSGNHGAALSLAARIRGLKATIVMPNNASEVKKRSVAELGGKIIFCPPTEADRARTLEEVIATSKAVFIHPYDNIDVICGQGTAAYELMREVPALDAVIAPVGGGGLLSGTATAVHGLASSTEILGAEPAQANDAYQSFHSKTLIPVQAPNTIADGLLTSLSPFTFRIIGERISEILLAQEKDIILAMRLVWERLKLVIEPSAAVPLAALLAARHPLRHRRIGVILSGGNIDLDHLPW